MINPYKIIYQEGRRQALELQDRSAAMTGTELNAADDLIPAFSEAVKQKNMLDRKAGQTDGFVCLSPAGRVVRLIQKYDSNVFTQTPEELPAQWRMVWSTDPAKAKPFIEFYGDTSYQGVVCPGTATALAYPIDKITISCEKDFDAEHPAGEPLDDVVKLDYTSFYNFVKGGYVYDFNKIPYDADFYSCTFDNVTADVTHLMQARTYGSYYGDRPVVVFASAPAEPHSDARATTPHTRCADQEARVSQSSMPQG